MIASTITRPRRLLSAGLFAVSLVVGGAVFVAPVASAAPCPPGTRASQCCVQYGDIAGTNQTCRHELQNDGLLGDAPVLGNLPGLGGLL
jgi:hypothetical protein